MKLHSFQIVGFKSIVDSGRCEFPHGERILVLAGQNEAGKSSVIEALRYFQEGDKEKDFNDLYRRDGVIPVVRCWFELSDVEVESLGTLIETNLRKHKLQDMKVMFFREESEDGEHDLWVDEEFVDAVVRFHDLEHPELAVSESEQTEDNVNEGEAEAVSDPATSLSKVIEGFLFEASREFIFYDSFEDILPGEVSASELKKFAAVRDFQKVFQIDFEELLNETNEKKIVQEEQRLNRDASDDLNKYWKQRLEPEATYKFQIKI